MKKSMKRYLSFLLAIMMLVTSVAFSVSAGECAHLITDKVEVYPTCETQGYVHTVCKLCGADFGKSDYKEPYGHKIGAEKYEPVLADGEKYDPETFDGVYRKYYNCTRTNCGKKIVDMENGKEVVYYLVRFYNNRVTDEDGYDKSITYTKVADPNEYKEVLVYSTYVKAGTEAVYENKLVPAREKTKAFPRYTFIGWTEENDLEADATDNLAKYECADLSKINGNKKYYPVFVGETNDKEGVITYSATIYIVNESGVVVPGTVRQDIPHGKAPKYRNPDGEFYAEPVKPEDIVNTYTFNGWSTSHNDYSGISGIFTKGYEREDGTYVPGIEETPVYGNVGFYPTFTATPKNYTLRFCTYDQSSLLKYSYTKNVNGKTEIVTEEAEFKGIHLGKNLIEKYEGVLKLNNDPKATERVSDDTYIYIWTGKWAIVNKDDTVGRTIDLKNFNIYQDEYKVAVDKDGNTIYETYVNADGEEVREEMKIITLVPVYDRVKQLYAVKIKMDIPDTEDEDYYLGEADVHVVANNDQLVASGKTNADGEFICYLYDQRPFTVTVATQDEKYLGTATINYLTKIDGDTVKEAEINKCLVVMSMNPDYETHCTCIHHNALIQPIWVRVLNILYSLFNRKYVCCYDMYSTIGPLLQYTA